MIYGLEERCQHVAVSNESEMLTFWSINTASVIVRLEDKYFIAEFIQKLRRLVTCQLPASLAVRSPLKCAPPDQNEWNFFKKFKKKSGRRAVRSSIISFDSGTIPAALLSFFFPRLDRMKKKACGGTCVSSITRPLISSFSEPTKKKKKRTKVRKTFSPPNDFRQLETLSSENDAVYSLNSFTAQNKSKLEFKSTGTALWPHVEVEPI